MKINGKTLNGPKSYTLVMPIGEDDYVVFKFRPLTSKDKFEDIMPRPKPPQGTKPGGEVFLNTQDPKYKAAIEDWADKKINWEFLQSISATDGLEWETVKMDDPNTWNNWKNELEDNLGITQYNRVFGGFIDANTLNEDRIEECRQRFLASQANGQ